MSNGHLTKQRRKSHSPPAIDRQAFVQRLLMTVGMVTAVAFGALLLWHGAEVILLAFTGLLVAVFLHSLSAWVRHHTGLGAGSALLVVVIVLIALMGLGGWLLAPVIAEQVTELTQRLPHAVTQARQRLAQAPLGQQIVAQMPPLQQLVPRSGNILARVTGMFSTVLGVVVNVVIVLFIGIYLAADPGLYRRGIVRLIPRPKRDRGRDVLDALGYTLRWWLVGRLSVMAINGLLTALGLWLLGIPLPVVLGLMTAVLNFIPNIGPFLAAIPAVLLAFTFGLTKALYVALLYLAVQNLEGFVLTPLIQQRTVSLPPVLVITAQILMGIMFGFLGVLLAVPLTAVLFVMVRMLYVQDTLGDPVEAPGMQQAGASH
ncbi:MAG: AI-2E family transporter [Chloroflexota bacterium]|nr:AI-2E family transporter [Chloroflexota bacterium]